MRSDRVSISWSNKKFSAFIKDFIDATQADTSVVLRKFAFDLLTRVVMRTPVATGRARAGWTAAGDALGVDIPPAHPSSSELGRYEEQLEGERQYIKIVNNVEYILPLEYGHSKQAPFGMVRITMAEMRTNDTLLTDIMKMYQERWGGMGSKQRYKVQGYVLSDVFGQIKNMDLGPRRPK